jgi:hypothetical protein
VVISILLKILTIHLLHHELPRSRQEIWKEEFTIPGKGIWGKQ